MPAKLYLLDNRPFSKDYPNRLHKVHLHAVRSICYLDYHRDSDRYIRELKTDKGFYEWRGVKLKVKEVL